METKRCACCQREKTTHCFGLHRSKKDGLCSYCKDCENKRVYASKVRRGVIKNLGGKRIKNTVKHKTCVVFKRHELVNFYCKCCKQLKINSSQYFYRKGQYLSSRCKVCDNERYIERRKKYPRAYYNRKQKEYIERNKQQNLISRKKSREKITDSYSRKLICLRSGLKNCDITQELVDLQRANLLLKRTMWRKENG